MSDIVERLRHCADNCGDEYLRELSGRAADEIERLKAELLERDAVWLPEKDAEIERLKAEVSALNHAEVKLLVQVDEQDAEIERLRAALAHADAKGQENDKLLWGTIKDNERLRAALRYALENGTTAVYWGDDDECGTYSCCGEVSYKPHENDCWTVKARAALKEDGE